MSVVQTMCRTLKKGDKVTFFGEVPNQEVHPRTENPLYVVTRDWNPDDPEFVYTDDPRQDDLEIAHDMWDGDAPCYLHKED